MSSTLFMKKETYYIIGYTINGIDLAVCTSYSYPVLSYGCIAVFKNTDILKKAYENTVKSFKGSWSNVVGFDEKFRGGRVWIRKLNGKHNFDIDKSFRITDYEGYSPRVKLNTLLKYDK